MKYKKKTLKNGLRIITVPSKDVMTATVMVMVETGTKYEDKSNNGISHFLEHMCFKGTKKRPNAGDISLELDSLGAASNAFTSYEYTGYYAKAHSKYTHKLVDIISDIYLNSTFDERELEKEKGVIVEEMNMIKDAPASDVGYLLLELMYGDQPVGRTVLGDKNFIKKATREDFVKYHKEHYVASATTIVIAGNFDEKKIIKEVEKKFENISTSKKHKKVKVKDFQKKPQLLVKNKKSDQTHLALAFRGVSLKHKDEPVLNVIATLLGQGMSSRLFVRLRDEMGVCYYVRSGSDTLTDHGIFEVTAGVDNKRLKEVVGVILEELKKLKLELVSEKELKKVMDFKLGHFVMSLESPHSFATSYAIQETLENKITLPKDRMREIKAVTVKDIKRVANKIFKNEGLNLAMIGPQTEKDKKDLLKILKI